MPIATNRMKTTTLISFFFLSACSAGQQSGDTTEATEASPINWEDCSGVAGDHPCNILSFNQDNKPFDLYDFYGQPIVVDLSAMWCAPCKAAAAEAQAVQDIYAEDNLIYITVLVENTDRDAPSVADLRAWADTYGNITSPVVAGARSMLESSGKGTWAVEGWPTFYYIDREMVTKDIDRGWNSDEVIYSIDWLLSLDKKKEEENTTSSE